VKPAGFVVIQSCCRSYRHITLSFHFTIMLSFLHPNVPSLYYSVSNQYFYHSSASQW